MKKKRSVRMLDEYDFGHAVIRDAAYGVRLAA
jgi:hypothetical protein